MDKEKIAGKIELAQKAQQERLNVLAKSDAQWLCLQTEINVWNQVLGEIKEDVPKKEVK